MRNNLLFVIIFFCITDSKCFAVTNHDSLACSKVEKNDNECKNKEEITMKWYYEEKEKKLRICYSESEIKKKDPQQWQYMSTHTSYPFEEDYPLPEALWQSLGASTALVIKSGNYPIFCNNDICEIIIFL